MDHEKFDEKTRARKRARCVLRMAEVLAEKMVAIDKLESENRILRDAIWRYENAPIDVRKCQVCKSRPIARRGKAKGTMMCSRCANA